MRQKRKPSTSQHLDSEKRQCLSWNMYDAGNDAQDVAGPSTSQTDEGIEQDVELRLYDLTGSDSQVHMVPDPASGEEDCIIDLTGEEDFHEQILKGDPISEEIVHTEPSEVKHRFHVTRSKFNILQAAANYEVKVQLDQPQERDSAGLLCSIKLRLLPVDPTVIGEPNPELLPSDKFATLLLRDTPGSDFLVFQGKAIGPWFKLKFSKTDSLQAFSVEMEKRPSTSCLESFKELTRIHGGKLFQLCLRDYDPVSGCAVIDAWLLPGIVSRPAYGAQCPSNKIYFRYVIHLMNWYHGFPIPALGKYKVHKRYDYNTLFDKVREYHQTQEVVDRIDVQHPILVPVLRPYQRDAVCWMVMKEKVKQNDKSQLHVLWTMFKTVDDKTLYYNAKSGEITDQRQEMPEVFPGGILADEMGLGKTVEVLATILAHSRWSKDHDSQDKVSSSPAQDKSDNALQKNLAIDSMNKVAQNNVASSSAEDKSDNACHKDLARDKEIPSSSEDDTFHSCEEGERDVATPAGNEQFCIKTTGARVSPKNPDMPHKDIDSTTVNGQMVPSIAINGTEVKSITMKVKTDADSKANPCNHSVQQLQTNTSVSGPDVQYASQALDQSNSSSQNKSDKDTVCSQVKEDAKEEAIDPPNESEDQMETTTDDDEEEPVQKREVPKVFQCVCGKSEKNICQPLCVQCLRCQSWLHAKCISFDIHMPATPSEDLQFWCPHCFPKVPPLVSGATLIISPASICHQWVDEINRHINSSTLNVMVYEGVKKQGYVQPKTLAECDIVITTYNTLQIELNYANLSRPGTEARSLRHAKRYQTTPSPLPCVEWWRVCLDEAQMIECPTAKSAEMANRLSARNRWCITGTPIQKSLDDLYGLFLFLGVEPYWVKHWWDLLLSVPYSRGNREPLQKALCKVFWRSAKRDVLDQINLPPQREEIHWLDFSAVETYFYKRKHEECSTNFTFLSNKSPLLPETKLSTLDRKSLQSLLGPLLRVRQACCHPHVVRGEFTNLQKKKQLTMEDLLKTMITKAEIDCDGAHRQLVCSINALAAVHCIRDEYQEAVALYREVLNSAKEQEDHIKTDKLQMMHAIHNLKEILKDKPEVVEPKPEDGDLSQRMEFFRDQYLQKAENLVTNSLQTLQPIKDKVLQQQGKIPAGPAWYLDGIQWVIYRGLGQDLVERLKTELEAKCDVMGLADKFQNARGFQFVLVSELDELAKLYKAAWAGVTSLQTRLKNKELLVEATDCHLRPFKGRTKHTCPFCVVEDQLQAYEMKLFSFDVRNMEAQEAAAGPSNDNAGPNLMAGGPRGNWAASEPEKALRILHSFLRGCVADDNTLEEGSIFLEMLEQQRKEFKPLRAYWGAMRDRVAAMDELEMAMLRLRVKFPGEETDPASQPYIIERGEITQLRYKFLGDRLFAQNDLRRKMGQLVYLQNLNKAQFNLKDGHNPELCPVCCRPLGKQWTVLQCGHCFCHECMELLLKNVRVAGRQNPVSCAVCRRKTKGADISVVSVSPQRNPLEEEEEDERMKVKGEHSTKIGAVLKTLKEIQRKEPGAKSIIFSTWATVLDLIASALKLNEIKFVNAVSKGKGQQKFQAALMDFKHDYDITVLLLPVHSGSKGLNLIEATHVLLVEPILNPASEMQAVGRVHRIGQTKPTVVHRFLVHETIEEKLYTYLRTHTIRDGLNSVETDTGDMTFSDLKDLFSSET